MTVMTPSITELSRIAEAYGFDLSTTELEDIRDLSKQTLLSLARIDMLEGPRLPVKYARDAGSAPKDEENEFNAWAWRCSIKGANEGKLANRTIALKDNICLAGIPLSNGSSVLTGFVPNEDATVVTRILDAGGEIAGKAVCENFSLSGGSHTSHGKPVLNPANKAHCAGGSSSGSGALVAAGSVDMALGGDQGGIDPDPSLLVWNRGAQTHLRSSPLHRYFPDREHPRPYRSHDQDRGGRSATAGGVGRAG